jgi:pimeloyl-ACP methyl ester carboxylesterase
VPGPALDALQTLSLNGHRVAYREAGEGAPVVLVHGIAGDSRTWREPMRYLARTNRVLAPDLPGHGESDAGSVDYSLGAHASFLRDLLAAIGVAPVTVVGHSLGGGVALQLAYQFPDLCQRLVLVSSGGLGPDVSRLLRLLSLPGAELVLPLFLPAFVRERGERLAGWLRQRGVRSPRLAETWHSYANLFDPTSRATFIRELRAVVDHRGQVVSAASRLHLATHPVLIVWGDRDPIIPVAHAHAAHRAIPGSRLVVFEGVEHFPHAEQPERFAEVVASFLDSTRATDAA